MIKLGCWYQCDGKNRQQLQIAVISWKKFCLGALILTDWVFMAGCAVSFQSSFYGNICGAVVFVWETIHYGCLNIADECMQQGLNVAGCNFQPTASADNPWKNSEIFCENCLKLEKNQGAWVCLLLGPEMKGQNYEPAGQQRSNRFTNIEIKYSQMNCQDCFEDEEPIEAFIARSPASYAFKQLLACSSVTKKTKDHMLDSYQRISLKRSQNLQKNSSLAQIYPTPQVQLASSVRLEPARHSNTQRNPANVPTFKKPPQPIPTLLRQTPAAPRQQLLRQVPQLQPQTQPHKAKKIVNISFSSPVGPQPQHIIQNSPIESYTLRKKSITTHANYRSTNPSQYGVNWDQQFWIPEIQVNLANPRTGGMQRTSATFEREGYMGAYSYDYQRSEKGIKSKDNSYIKLIGSMDDELEAEFHRQRAQSMVKSLRAGTSHIDEIMCKKTQSIPDPSEISDDEFSEVIIGNRQTNPSPGRNTLTNSEIKIFDREQDQVLEHKRSIIWQTSRKQSFNDN